MSNANLTKYPREVAAVVRKTKAIAISAYYNLAKADEGDTPLAIYDKTFSRLTVAALDTEAKGKGSATANIPVRELAEIFVRTDYAFTKHMDALYSTNDSDAEPTSSAYTVRISAGTLKGKTPAEVLIDDPEGGMEALKKQYAWLKENAEKYPKNKVQMQAIKEASDLLKAGKLSAASAKSANKPIVLYNAEARALIRKKREDGMCPVHNLDIVWNLGEDSPVCVTVTNFYAPVLERADGTISPQVKNMDRESMVRISMNCTSKEWLNTIRAIKASMSQFEMLNCKKCIEDSTNAEIKGRQAANAATTA